MVASEPVPLLRHIVSPHAAEAVARVLASECIGEGPESAAFERELEPWIGPNAVVSSGTAALWLAYVLAGIGPGTTVVTSPLGCLASTQTLLHVGARIVWADVDPETGMLDLAATVRAVRDWGAAHVVGVEWGGSRIDWPAFRAALPGVRLIADAAHSFGAPVPPLDAVDFAAYSFQAIKTLTTGDGGALACRRGVDVERARLKRWFGLDRRRGQSMRCLQAVATAGYKFQLNDVAAAIGRANLRDVVAPRLAAQRAAARVYDKAFRGTAVRPLRRSADAAAWLYSVRVADAVAFATAMAARGVAVGPVHARMDTQPLFGGVPGALLPGMDTLARELVCLPCGPWVDPAEVIAAAKECARAVP